MSMVDGEIKMLDLTKLDEEQIAEILEDNGYNSDGILDVEFLRTNDRDQAIYKMLWHDDIADEFGSSTLFFHYMSNGTIWADYA